ncbi:MAG: 50S ribosomal protein L10 [Phycisphaeraceae bacterium]|nr:50S ribosomal protein L10 [Phycisphaeraceae bacterium]
MSKPVKNLTTLEYKKRFGDLEGAVLIDIRGITSNDNNKLRAGLQQKKVRVTVVKNNLARRAFDGTKMASISDMLDGPSALVYGGDSVVTVAREVLAQIKTMENIQVKGALMDGIIFKGKEVEALSKYPTRSEAQAQVIQVFLGPAAQAIGAIVSAGNTIASLIKAVEDKLEKGETIAKIA